MLKRFSQAAAGIALAAFITVAVAQSVPVDARPLNVRLEGKSRQVRASMKSDELVRRNPIGIYNNARYGVRVKIQSVKKIDGGVEIYAQAWKGSQQLGFSDDGSVDVERFLIYNPPILVDDANGAIDRSFIENGRLVPRKLRLDPIAAIQEALAHTVKIVGKEGTKIVPGKIGKTTSTFYPDAGDPAAAAVDGYCYRDGVDGTWASYRGGAGTGCDNTDANGVYAYMNYNSTGWQQMQRGITLFNSAALVDSETITSATYSLRGISKSDQFSQSVGVTTAAPASNTTLAASDYDVGNHGTTRLATDITITSWSIVGYNDFALNASGIAAISKTGITKFSMRLSGDIDDTEPTPAATTAAYARAVAADNAGTTADPTLTVVTAAPSTSQPIILLLSRIFAPSAYAR